MKEWFGGKRGGAVAFLAICVLVAGGLGWVTAAALRLESEQLAGRADAERADRMRLALWRLDSYVAPPLAVEDGRPFNHYSAVFAAPFAFDNRGTPRPAGAVVEPSPLLNADLPDWMLLHFQLDAACGWESPQAPSPNLATVLRKPPLQTLLTNVTPQRATLLDGLKRELKPDDLIADVRERVSPTMHMDKVLLPAKGVPNYANNDNRDGANQAGPYNDFQLRMQNTQLNNSVPVQMVDRSLALNSLEHNGENWVSAKGMRGAAGAEVLIHLSPMTALWAQDGNGRDRLLLVRLVRIEEKEVCQGILLDDGALRGLLADKVADLFPDARLLPVHEPEPPQPDRTMTALPFQLDPGPAPPPPNPGWTPLRVGLVLAWTAALVALVAVGLGGWSLIDLSQRRIRFVSAVTHELRTPLTTLRLYLDMLMNGLVRDENQRAEYIQTLNAESDRLSRLVGNVLDYSRLENRRPRLCRASVSAADLLSQVGKVWQGRCHNADKELVIENGAGAATLRTDGELVQQILGNLLDNACKYSRGASDPRVWLRVRSAGRRVVFEVEDRGSGVPKGERKSIFRAFRRGRTADATGGGVGLGLALARRWARLLGGELALRPASPPAGACFWLFLPTAAP